MPCVSRAQYRYMQAVAAGRITAPGLAPADAQHWLDVTDDPASLPERVVTRLPEGGKLVCMTTTTKAKHRPDPEELDRCVCGGQIVYFEGDFSHRHGYGCETLGWPTAAFQVWKED